MNIAFFGLSRSFDIFQIGGSESFIRRLSAELVIKGIRVEHILYGHERNEERELARIKIKYFIGFTEALRAVEVGNYDHVVTIFLKPRNRIRYALYRNSHSNNTIYHHFYFSWSDSIIKRRIFTLEARLVPYNGKLICLSSRLFNELVKWTNRVEYLLPSVPKEYYLKPEEKAINKKIKITFLGRIDPYKGINEVINIFSIINKTNKYETSIYGIHFPENKESMRIHTWLKGQSDIKYISIDRQHYSQSIENSTRTILKETDVFIQPYLKLSNTVDTPLLILEAMASLCAVITNPISDITQIYGDTKFLIKSKDVIGYCISIINSLSIEILKKERERIYLQNCKILNKYGNIGETFLQLIYKQQPDQVKFLDKL